MKGIKTLAVLVSLAAIAVAATDASAYYNPRLGRFMQRDPGPDGPMRVGGRFAQRDPVGQYADGMNLYEYVRSSPPSMRDPRGTDSIPGQSDFDDIPLGGDFDRGKVVSGLAPTRYMASVRDAGRNIGTVFFTRFDEIVRSEDPGLSGTGRTGKERSGLDVVVEFTRWVDLSSPPHCCDEVRWTQIVSSESYKRPGKPAPFIDGFDHRAGGVPKYLFYYRTEARRFSPHDPSVEFLKPRSDPQFVGSNRRVDAPTRAPVFKDRPNAPSNRWPYSASFKLCLVCVSSQNKEKTEGQVRPLKCFSYGYAVYANDRWHNAGDVEPYGPRTIPPPKLPKVKGWKWNK